MERRDATERWNRYMQLIDMLETTKRDIRTTERGAKINIQDEENNGER
jgi:hypothetical protein